MNWARATSPATLSCTEHSREHARRMELSHGAGTPACTPIHHSLRHHPRAPTLRPSHSGHSCLVYTMSLRVALAITPRRAPCRPDGAAPADLQLVLAQLCIPIGRKSLSLTCRPAHTSAFS